jgi:glycosyl transferase family 25
MPTPPANPLAVDAVYVLTVKTFRDRIAHATRELGRHGIPFEFIFDFDIPDLDEALLAKRFGDTAMPLPQKSLALKHLHAWRLACERGQGRILVFEDDALLHRHFVGRFNAAMEAAAPMAPGWLIYLGGADAKVPDSFFLARTPLIPQPIATAEGYVTDVAACGRRVAWCDVNVMDRPADHLIRRVDQAVDVREYWLPDSIVQQGSVTGMFDSVLDSHRMKHSRFFNIARNRWNKLQRRQLRRLWVNAKNFGRTRQGAGG